MEIGGGIMNDVEQKNDDLISCELCLKEVPQSEAKNVEVNDYVVHFCGLDCYDKWQDQDQQ